MARPLRLATVRSEASAIEAETRRSYERAAAQATDAGTRQLLDELAEQERVHEQRAGQLEKKLLYAEARDEEDEARRKLLLLQVVQPGLAGLMDGSVSTLAPLFAAAFATHSTRDAFTVGLAVSLGAGISMGFAEALSDDGSLKGRGLPWVRGLVCGAMTALGGIGHALPYLLPQFALATTLAGIIVVNWRSSPGFAIATWIPPRCPRPCRSPWAERLSSSRGC